MNDFSTTPPWFSWWGKVGLLEPQGQEYCLIIWDAVYLLLLSLLCLPKPHTGQLDHRKEQFNNSLSKRRVMTVGQVLGWRQLKSAQDHDLPAMSCTTACENKDEHLDGRSREAGPTLEASRPPLICKDILFRRLWLLLWGTCVSVPRFIQG